METSLCVRISEKRLELFYKLKKKTPLEKIEDLEYLRFIELGVKLRGLKMSKQSIAVDTIHDVKLVKKRLKS